MSTRRRAGALQPTPSSGQARASQCAPENTDRRCSAEATRTITGPAAGHCCSADTQRSWLLASSSSVAACGRQRAAGSQ